MSLHETPKDPKKSVRQKYNRRREFLRHILEQFLIVAKDRIDEEKYGKIYKKSEVSDLIEGAQDLLSKFPLKEEKQLTQIDFDNFLLMLDKAAVETEKMSKNFDKDIAYVLKEQKRIGKLLLKKNKKKNKKK